MRHIQPLYGGPTMSLAPRTVTLYTLNPVNQIIDTYAVGHSWSRVRHAVWELRWKF